MYKLNFYKILNFLCLSYLVTSCSSTSQLGFQKHVFNRLPNKIIWIQLPGLSEEHISMLKFNRSSTDNITSFEKSNCVGQMWSYNLYDLRPGHAAGLESQLLGKKNIQKECENYEQSPIWKQLIENGYQAGIFEAYVEDSSSMDIKKRCEKQAESFLNKVTFWKMTTSIPAGSKMFHEFDQNPFEVNEVYYDKSCNAKNCFSNQFKNILSIFHRYQKDKSHFLFLIRDFSYIQFLNKRDISSALEVLDQYEKLIDFFNQKANEDDKYLLLVTSSAGVRIDFPDKGKDWTNIASKSNLNFYKRSALVSPAFAMGSRAENFCGIYEEAEIYQRILKGSSHTK